MTCGFTSEPPFANTAKPSAISSGVSCAVPSAAVRSAGMCSAGRPKRCTYSRAKPTPIWRITRIVTRLRERASASRSRVGP